VREEGAALAALFDTALSLGLASAWSADGDGGIQEDGGTRNRVN